MTPIKGPIAPDPAGEGRSASLLLIALGGFFVLFGLVSHLVRGRYFMPSSVLATLLGIALGPKGAKLFAVDGGSNRSWTDGTEGEGARSVLLWACRIVLSIQVLQAGLHLPSRYLAVKKNIVTLMTLLFPCMCAAWILSAGTTYALVADIKWLEALVIGACLGPTDPILAGSVLNGYFAERHVAGPLRHALLCESGVNDGLATPFLYLAIQLLMLQKSSSTTTQSTGSEVANYLLSVVLYNVALAILLGILSGYGLRKMLEYSQKREWIDTESMLVFPIAAALLLCGITSLIDSNQLLACFMAGITIMWHEKVGKLFKTEFAAGLEDLLDIVIFTVLGATIPFDEFADQLGSLFLIAFLIMFLRRLPAVLLFGKALPSIKSWGETAFAGWFGPIGIGALYYSLESAEKVEGQPHLEKSIYAVVTFIILTSVFVHGLTIPFFLLSTYFFPRLAPALLGEREEVGHDFGGDGLNHLIDGNEQRSDADERQPLINR